MLPDLHVAQWLLAGLAAVLVGCAKTGIPGIGVLVVPLMAIVFGGRVSVGLLLPLLLFADCFAVWFYQRHAQWDKLWRLVPWVALGIPIGAVVLYWLAPTGPPDAPPPDLLWGMTSDELFKRLIGIIVLSMVALHLARQRWPDALHPEGRVSVAMTGALTGTATTIANAAGPIMQLYLAGMNMPKEQFMGTNAWFFLLLNTSKVPVYILLSLLLPREPLFSGESLLIDAILCPLIVGDVFLGRWLLTVVSQHAFDLVVIILAAVAGLKLAVIPNWPM